MPDCEAHLTTTRAPARLTQKSGKSGPIDKDWTPSYLCRSTSQALSGGAIYVARRMKPETRHPEGASGGASRIQAMRNRKGFAPDVRRSCPQAVRVRQ